MDMYLSEEERVEALQRWWKANRSALFMGLLLGLLVISGWRGWQSHQQGLREAASETFHRLTQALSAKQTTEAASLATRLVEAYGQTTYADFARLTLAKLKADAGDFEAARLRLEEELQQGQHAALKDVARLRLARVHYASGQYAQGLEQLSKAGSVAGALKGLMEEVRGDLLAALARPSEARVAYQAAKAEGNRSPLLDLKLHDLPATER